MITKPYLIGIISTLLISAVTFVGGSFYKMIDSRDKEISSLREELLSKQVEIAKRNFELQKQADEFHAFNNKRHEYEQHLVSKYAVPKNTGNPCDSGIIDSLLRKSFYND